MLRLCVSICVILLGVFAISPAATENDGKIQETAVINTAVRMPGIQSPAAVKAVKEPAFGNVPLYFIPNKGQVNETARFYAKTSRYTLWMTKQGLVFDTHQDASRLVFLEANREPEMAPVELTRHRVNYYKGSDRSKWHSGIQTSTAVLYKNVYKNVDLKVYGIEKQIEYDWVVKPGAGPGVIRFRYEGAQSTRIDEQGNLVIKTEFGELTHKKPVSYQLIDGKKVDVDSQFRRIAKNIYGFNVESYDTVHPLIIDPVVVPDYSTYLGGSSNEYHGHIAVDNEGHVYLVGYTGSTNFPVKNAYKDYKSGYYDAYLTKFDPSGTELLFSTYFGGSSSEYFSALSIAPNGDIYIGGDTFSTNMPASYNSYSGSKDGFIARFDSSGNYLEGRYLGGSSEDRISTIITDKTNNVYIIGWTRSSNFPTKDPFQSSLKGGISTFIHKLKTDLSGILYSTYLGGTGYDYGARIAVDEPGNIYVFGRTSSSDFPLKTPYQSSYGGGSYDAFIAKLKPDGSGLVFSTFLGGNGSEYSEGFSLDKSGVIYIAGRTDSSDFPTKNALQGYLKGGYDTFAAKIKPDGSDLIYSTYLGGSADDQVTYCVVDDAGNLYLCGRTYCTDFPTRNPFQATLAGSGDGFISAITPDGSDLLFSTYFGGSSDDFGYKLGMDGSGRLYLQGFTKSSDLPVKNAYQGYNGGQQDAFLVRFSLGGVLTITSTTGTAVPIEIDPVDLDGNGSGYTDFTRYYEGGSEVTLTAPETFNGKSFYRWIIDGTPRFTPSIQITINGDHSAEVEYMPASDIVLDKSQLVFGYSHAGFATGPLIFRVDRSGGSTLDWTVSDNATWLRCSPEQGSNYGEVSVWVNGAGLPAGVYQGTITVSAAGAANSPQYIYVTMIAHEAGGTNAPFGSFDSPVEGVTVYGSIPVTGWTLDDIEVNSVKIYREEGKKTVYIGDAVFVEGARPDVEIAYPNYPGSSRAGWGYMLLTNALPNNGNGTFTLHAIATDKEGNQVTIGKKVIICDNANAVKPFGAIDTPEQGGSASGSLFINWGWVLTPLPNHIPVDGSTIDVWVDGVNLGHPVYNIYREDIATFFPGYSNSDGAVGYFYLDTTAYENGVHSIHWTATDSVGNTDGIGSRYFTVANISGERAQTLERGQARNLLVRRKKDSGQRARVLYPNERGATSFEIKELEPIEVHLPSPVYTGYQIVKGFKRSLPTGSTLDKAGGVFYWLPPHGHLGEFHFAFIETGTGGEMVKRLFKIKVVSKFKTN